MNSFVLSIVIPTYSRAEKLNLLLFSLSNSFSVWPNGIEVVILDNASTDNTAQIVSNFLDIIPIKYVRRPNNIGMDGNIASCFDATSGKYLWILGDDEILYRNSLKYIFEVCSNNDFGILHLENGGFKSEDEHIIGDLSIPENPEIISLNSELLFRNANIFLTFISANITNKLAVIKKFPDFNSKSDINTFLPQMAWTYSALKAVDNHFFIRTPMFGALIGNTGGYKFIEVFGVNLINLTNKYFPLDTLKSTQIMSNAVITRLIPGELIAQFGKIGSKSNFANEDINTAIYNSFGEKIYFKIFLKPILSNSLFLRKFFFILVRVFNKLNKKMGFIFL